MHIAILGATSQIGRDLVESFAVQGLHQLTLFARRPDAVVRWLGDVGLSNRFAVQGFEGFSREQPFDVIINFVGVGNPATAVAMGASIFDLTHQFDQMVLDYLQSNNSCRYIFLSSGAAYGSTFETPASHATKALIPLNAFGAQDWYGVAKLYAECRHRALSHLDIIDIRIFNYFSRSQDLSARFLISDILRSIRDGIVLQTSRDSIVRDYLHPADFHQLIERLLVAPAGNRVLDCYSRAPTSKEMLLAFMGERFGLRYEVVGAAGVNATGRKASYYSVNRQASEVGYDPRYSSLEGIEVEASTILQT